MKTTPVATTREVQKSLSSLGSLNPEALSLPSLQPKNSNKQSDQIGRLTERLAQLTEENAALKQEITDLLQSDGAFSQFQNWINAFEARIRSREDEFNAFASHLTHFKTKSHPTFVEVSASDQRDPRFDQISYSLLVSNQQENNFEKETLKEKYDHLIALVHNQEQSIRLTNAQLKVFNDIYKERIIQQKMEALKRGERPTAILYECPTVIEELRAKHQQMSQELSNLIKERKQLQQPYQKEKDALRHETLRFISAVKIQRVFRKFIIRKYAATAIQSAWRGFWTRQRVQIFIDKALTESTHIAPQPSTFITDPQLSSRYSAYDDQLSELSTCR